MPLELLAAAACLLLALYYFLTRNYNHWEQKNIPYEKPFLFFGSMYRSTFRREHVQISIQKLYRKFKTQPYFGIYVFTRPTLVIKSPDLIRTVLVKNFDKFADRQGATNEKADPISFHNLFSAKGDVWKAVRSKISPVFTSGKMKLMLPLMRECADNLAEVLRENADKSLEFKDLLSRYSVDTISSCAFGINAHCLKDANSEMRVMTSRLFDVGNFRRGFSIFCFFFLPKFVDWFRLTFLDYAAQQYLIKVFSTTMHEREKNGIVRNDMIDLLSNLRKAETITETYKFDDIKMASQSITFFAAGSESTSGSLSLALYELALHPDIQDRLRKEICTFHQKHGGFSYEALQDMKYMDMVLNEVLRKYPFATFLNRDTTADFTIDEKTGFTVDKGTFVMIPVAALHYDPEHFPNPEVFDPDRFNDENKINIKPYTYMPFGDGPRNCIGQRFALLNNKVALARVLKDFSFKPTAETKIPLKLQPGSPFFQTDSGIFLKASAI